MEGLLSEGHNKRKPVLIVSQPVCFEGMILKILGITPPCQTFNPLDRKKQIKDLKSALSGVLKNVTLLEYCKENLSKDLLEERRQQIPQLDLLIKMVEP